MLVFDNWGEGINGVVCAFLSLGYAARLLKVAGTRPGDSSAKQCDYEYFATRKY